MLLILSIISVSFVHDSKAQEISSQEKALTIIADVVGVDISKHTINPLQTPQNNYLGVLPQENVRYTIGSNGSREADVRFSFVNGHLRLIHVLEYNDALILKETKENPLEQAKAFLSNYQDYSKDAFYGQINSMLTSDAYGKNLTVIQGNVKLEVSTSECYSTETYRWTYTLDGVDAPRKCVVLGYENGFLKYFIDNWALYAIGSTKVNVSEEEAIQIAMDKARTYSWAMSSNDTKIALTGFTVTNAMVWETIFCSNMYADQARSDDPLTLYPMRHIWVSLDKFYPGNVYGFNVYVWADTGEVCYIQERFSTLDPPEELVATPSDYTIEQVDNKEVIDPALSSVISNAWVVIPVFAVIVLGNTMILLFKKKSLAKRCFKINGALLCILMSSTVLLVPIATVGAEPTRSALIWGSESTGAWNDALGFSWRKTATEVSRQNVTSNAISTYFSNYGYDTKNYKGTNSIKAEILNNISSSASSHSHVAVIDFDHGVGNVRDGTWHYQFEDNIGTYETPIWIEEANAPENGVYDNDISQRTGAGKNFFTLINTCLSAKVNDWTVEWPKDSGNYYPVSQGPVGNGTIQGMPYAWTHRIVNWKGYANFSSANHISIFGYSDPDSSPYCYIGFPFGSAALSQTISGISPIYATWLENFMYYALYLDISINDALDQASLDNFDETFGDTNLYTGFTSIWPYYKDGSWHDGTGLDCTIAVYGNGEIHLHEYYLHNVNTYSGYGTYIVEYPNNLLGGSIDGQYASLGAAYSSSQAMIIANTGEAASGHIYMYGYTHSGYTSELYVYVSNDYQNWYQVGSKKTITTTSPYWIDIGTYSNDFQYMVLLVYCDGAYDVSYIHIDAVLVIPSVP